MEFKDQIKTLGDKVAKLKDHIQTEEATKTAFILPFFAILGYDVFNPTEVVPEFTADLGIKKGEKVDYCIKKDGKPIIIVECKSWGEDLHVHNSQLHRYFHVTNARFGLLTNGILYRFYSDLEQPNKMDDKPFLEFSLSDIKDNLIPEILKFHKDQFNVDYILNSATELKYITQVRAMIQEQVSNPSEEFVKMFANRAYQGRLMPKVLEQFSSIVKKAFSQYISDTINDRLKSALASESEREAQENTALMTEAMEDVKDKVETTEAEKEAFYIVKSILRNAIPSNRIFYRDNQSYLAVLVDDNNRRQVCRLHLNRTTKYLGLLDADNKETRVVINSIEDIYSHELALIESALRYAGAEVK